MKTTPPHVSIFFIDSDIKYPRRGTASINAISNIVHMYICMYILHIRWTTQNMNFNTTRPRCGFQNVITNKKCQDKHIRSLRWYYVTAVKRKKGQHLPTEWKSGTILDCPSWWNDRFIQTTWRRKNKDLQYPLKSFEMEVL